ncbi:hypothetical protein TIFTF001_036828 [Ficus carica]|uniref:Bulb-type lectin domain-containing protein n=1 Tax=Ficus carica TaxID=3494 RepID=A0AA88E7L9_FICCA|nr:hypothetical protein TIFTF001_036813 [Ficus carica]GMN67765.1 hypothetical protein TIFTF001_036828 [Ficus carica]
MACSFYMHSVMFVLLLSKSSAATTRNSSFPRTGYAYYLDSGRPSTCHNAVWSADTDHPLREDALLQLTRDKGLVLRRSDGTTVWSATNTTGTPVVGMNLTEAGNLVLFDSQSTAVWQSFDHPVDALLVGRRLYKGVFLVYFRQMRTTQDRILAFSYLKCCRRRPKRTESLTSWKTRMKTWKITPNKW